MNNVVKFQDKSKAIADAVRDFRAKNEAQKSTSEQAKSLIQKLFVSFAVPDKGDAQEAFIASYYKVFMTYPYWACREVVNRYLVGQCGDSEFIPNAPKIGSKINQYIEAHGKEVVMEAREALESQEQKSLKVRELTSDEIAARQKQTARVREQIAELNDNNTFPKPPRKKSYAKQQLESGKWVRESRDDCVKKPTLTASEALLKTPMMKS